MCDTGKSAGRTHAQASNHKRSYVYEGWHQSGAYANVSLQYCTAEKIVMLLFNWIQGLAIYRYFYRAKWLQEESLIILSAEEKASHSEVLKGREKKREREEVVFGWQRGGEICQYHLMRWWWSTFFIIRTAHRTVRSVLWRLTAGKILGLKNLRKSDVHVHYVRYLVIITVDQTAVYNWRWRWVTKSLWSILAPFSSVF